MHIKAALRESKFRDPAILSHVAVFSPEREYWCQALTILQQIQGISDGYNEVYPSQVSDACHSDIHSFT